MTDLRQKWSWGQDQEEVRVGARSSSHLFIAHRPLSKLCSGLSLLQLLLQQFDLLFIFIFFGGILVRLGLQGFQVVGNNFQLLL